MSFKKTLVLIFTALLVSSVSAFADTSNNRCTVFYDDLTKLKLEESNSRFQATSFSDDMLKLTKITEAAFKRKGYTFTNNKEDASLAISYINVYNDGVCGYSKITLTDFIYNQSVTFSDSKCGLVTALSKSGFVNSIKKALAQVPSCKKLKN